MDMKKSKKKKKRPVCAGGKKRPRVSQKKGAAKKIKKTASPTKMSIFNGLSFREVAAVIAAKLAENGHEAVLTGKSCAAFYCGNASDINSIEFAIRRFEPESVFKVMSAMGFYPRDDHTFASKKIAYEVVLFPMPIAIGDDVANEVGVVRTKKGPLKVLTPTDCLRQRLSIYYRWGEELAFAQAVKIARSHKVDMDLVRRWSDWEWANEKFLDFFHTLNVSKSSR